MSEEHQGYKNYETFIVAIWIEHNQERQEYARHLARLARDNAKNDPSEVLTEDEETIKNLDSLLKDWVEIDIETTIPLAENLLHAATSRVSFREIAHLIEDKEYDGIQSL